MHLPALLLACALSALAAADPVLVADGPRAVLDLAGTWEGVGTTISLPWPAPEAGWKPIAVPARDCALIDGDVGRYNYPFPAKVIAADGLGPAKTDKQAAWFRRTFDLPGGVPAGTRALLHCDGVAWRSAVRLNGTEVGTSILGVAPSTYDVTAAVQAGSNQLVIGATCRAGLWDAARKTFIAPTPAVMPGIWGGVRLELVPEIRIDDVWVRTSVAQKRLEVELTLLNAGAGRRTLLPTVSVRGPDGQPACALSAEAVTLSGGETRSVVLSAAWIAPHLWSASTPVVYTAEAVLREGAAVVDRRGTPFGFREFTAVGRDYQLNGRRQVLLRNSWLTAPGADVEQVYRQLRDETTHFNCIRLHIGFIDDTIIDQSDRVGMLVIPEFWAWYENQDQCWPTAQAAVWLPAAQEMMARLVKRYRNHPSVVMWSLANETMWNDTRPERMAVVDVLCKTVRASDPTRLLQGDAEITWDGRLDSISIHYPEGGALKTGTARDLYPNASWIVPNDLDFLKKEGVNRSWRAEFAWDRPLMIGEYYCMDDFVLEGCSAYMGDEAFDAGKWRWQAWDGREAIMPRQDNAWLRMAKISSDRYRAAGVACLNPWTGCGLDVIPPLLVRPLDLHPNAFGGETCTRRIFVANDTGQSWGGMHLQVGLQVGGRTLWSDERIPAQANPGEGKEVTVTLRPPRVEVVTASTLVVRLRWDRWNGAVEIARHEEPLWICPRLSLAGAEAAQVALVDTAEGPTAKAFAALGLVVTPGACDDAALAGKRLLVIGEGAMGMVKADPAAAARFVEAGGQVLVLHQEELEPFVPGLPELDPKHAASMTWRHDAGQPALAGLADGQLRWWRPDHLVATRSLVRPSAGPAASAAASGGRYGMHWSPLAEVRHGKGAVTVCQYLLCDRIDVEPAARQILVQAVRAALAATPTAPAPALRLAPGISKAVRAALADCSVWTVDGYAGDGPVLVDAKTPPGAEALARLRAGVEAGGALWLRGLDATTLPMVATLLPWTPGLAPLAATDLGAARRSDHHLISGLGTADFAWHRSRKSTAALGGPAVVLPSEGAAVILLEPALLVAVPLGSGVILIDQLAWDAAQTAETERVTRIVSCLARNLGAGFRFVAGKRYRFTGLDLAKHANRGYVDDTAGDGVGGWTDQGDNDLRYFLINHTGMFNGAAVPTQAFPTDSTFNGIPFRLLDPKANAGRSVITLRGGPHDPASPTEVRGIPAGGAKADRVWFLHAGCWGSPGGYLVTVARYEVVYADGSRVEVPVRQGREISDWWTPQPITGAQIAWTGRNEKHAPIGLYLMPWDNPSPDKAISAIDLVGSLAETQLVLLGVTLGIEDGAERTTASWDCGTFADGLVSGTGPVLKGAGTPVTVGSRALLRLAGGQALTTELRSGPLAERTPLAIEIEVVPDGKPGGYFGGLVEAGSYMQSGVRLMLRHDLKVVVEHYAGTAKEQASYLESKEPLAIGRLGTVRYEHDGRQARLLINGKLQQVVPCPLPAAWTGRLTVGGAGGKDYFLNGAVGSVRIVSLAPVSP